MSKKAGKTHSGPVPEVEVSFPSSRLAGRIHAAAPQGGGRDRGEGSVLGGVFDMHNGYRPTIRTLPPSFAALHFRFLIFAPRFQILRLSRHAQPHSGHTVA